MTPASPLDVAVGVGLIALAFILPIVLDALDRARRTLARPLRKGDRP